MSGLALAAGAVLLLGPGAWLAFAVPLPLASFTARLALAGVLSPFVVSVQFYAARAAGLEFGATAWALVALNAVALAYVPRRWREAREGPGVGSAKDPWNLALIAVLTACIAVPWFVDDVLRLFNFHAWLHASIAQQFASGRLWPEEPEVAGLRLAYPWLGHAYWAVLSAVAGRPYTQVYVATDVAALAWTALAVFETCLVLGASAACGRLAFTWLTLGTNVLGYWLLIATGDLHGDIRYTPWLRKFMISELSAFVISMLAGLMLAGVFAVRTRRRGWLALVVVLTAATGLYYAILLPAALAFSGLVVLWLWFDPSLGDVGERRRAAVGLALGLVAAAVLSAGYLRIVTTARAGAPVVLSTPEAMASKLATGLLAVAPFLVTIALATGRPWRRADLGVLLAAATVCYLLRPLVRLEGYGEYKFMFPTALFLAPAAAYAVETWAVSRVSMNVLVWGSLLVLLPNVAARGSDWGDRIRAQYPPVHETGEALELDAAAPEAGWIAAVRDSTPVDTVVAVRRTRFLLPVLTHRSLLGPAEATVRSLPGYWEASRFNLVGLRGYPAAVVDDRIAVLHRVYEVTDAAGASALCLRLEALHRPVALVFEPRDPRGVLDWLRQTGRGRELYRDANGTAVWLLGA